METLQHVACENHPETFAINVNFFTPFSHMFQCVIFHPLVKYECEIHVKSSAKQVKQMWKTHIIHTFFRMVFHIHTPSSVITQSLAATELRWPWLTFKKRFPICAWISGWISLRLSDLRSTFKTMSHIKIFSSEANRGANKE